MVHKTIVFGLDGASFELLDPWLERGALPNVERIIDSGVTADLQSVLPPVTSPNWKSYATGKNPGKLGIFWWENFDSENERFYYPHDRKSDHTEFWEYIADDRPVGVLGTPLTSPPKEIDGCYISGAPDAQNQDYAYPECLEELLEDRFDYRVLLQKLFDANKEEAVEEVLELIRLRFEVGEFLLKEYDLEFLQLTTFYINSLHHFFWNDEYTREAWKIVDEYVGHFVESDFNVVLMSDHGSNQIDTVFNVNTWLEKNGHLVTRTGIPQLFDKLGISRSLIAPIISTLGLEQVVQRLPRAIVNMVPDDTGGVKHEAKTDLIDWERSDAVASGQGPVYLNVDSDRREKQRSLQEDLSKLIDNSGRPVAENVYLGEDVYHGAHLDEAPDLVIDQASGVHISGTVGRNEVFSDPAEEGWEGENKQSGLFTAAGPDFGSGSVELSILDLAPTFLHLFGCQIPTEMDGEVRDGLFSEHSEPTGREPEFTDLTPEREGSERGKAQGDVEANLRDLGYID